MYLKKGLIVFVILFTAVGNCLASQINPIPLEKLHKIASIIALGTVKKIKRDGIIDLVTIQVALFLKGEGKEKEMTFTLVTRGGLKDSDPELKIGDTGVFFLKIEKGKIKKAYWGSIAIFNKNAFNIDK